MALSFAMYFSRWKYLFPTHLGGFSHFLVEKSTQKLIESSNESGLVWIKIVNNFGEFKNYFLADQSGGAGKFRIKSIQVRVKSHCEPPKFIIFIRRFFIRRRGQNYSPPTLNLRRDGSHPTVCDVKPIHSYFKLELSPHVAHTIPRQNRLKSHIPRGDLVVNAGIQLK